MLYIAGEDPHNKTPQNSSPFYEQFGSFRKYGVLIIRILLFRVLD